MVDRSVREKPAEISSSSDVDMDSAVNESATDLRQLRIHEDGPRVCGVDTVEKETEKCISHVDLDEVSVGSDNGFDYGDFDKSEIDGS